MTQWSVSARLNDSNVHYLCYQFIKWKFGQCYMASTVHTLFICIKKWIKINTKFIKAYWWTHLLSLRLLLSIVRSVWHNTYVKWQIFVNIQLCCHFISWLRIKHYDTKCNYCNRNYILHQNNRVVYKRDVYFLWPLNNIRFNNTVMTEK